MSEPFHGRNTPTSTARLSRRSFLRLAGAAAAGAALSACTPGAVPTPTPVHRGRVQLVYQDWRTDWFPPMVQEMLGQFHSQNPNISAFYIPDPENFEERMLADMQAGAAPDVFQASGPFFPILAQKGYALDLRPFIEADLDQATIYDWDPAQYHALATKSGVQFGVPKYHGALALYYNKDLFDIYEVDYPDASWDYADYQEAMRRLTDDRDGDNRVDLWGSMLDVSWDRLQVHVNAWGGHFVHPNDPSLCLMCEPEAIAALEWVYQRMRRDGIMATALDVQKRSTRQAFTRKLVAMVEDGSWALKDILTEADFRVGIAPMPAGPARRVTLATTDGFGIYAGTKHPEAAWELVKFLISRDYGRAMARASFLQPARASLVDEWVEVVRQEFPEKSKDADVAVFADGHLQGYSVVTEVFANMADAKSIASAAWDRIFSLGRDGLDEMRNVCQAIQQTQRPGR
ncbi:MAG: sugar ABC transporter substrate-binding protein [Chloroflexi bacterium]|nr:sugar ABC transporter substrate-binding protein [Chloroflexota bacterium]